MIYSYHYYYYYCYDYDDYPSCCCCSVLLNDFLSWMNMICCTLKHLWSSVFLRMTNQKEKQTKKPPTFCYLHPVSDLQTFPGHYCHLGFRWPWISQAWLNNVNMMFMQTHVTFHDDLFCFPAVYGLCTLSVCSLLIYFSLYPRCRWLFALPTGFSL